MFKLYGYLGIALIILVEINFYTIIKPFALWYLPIIWLGYILFVDSLVYKIKKKSMISSYPKEIIFMALISVPFWLIFELYNKFTGSWYYVNYIWYLHLIDFTTIVPAVLETFCLFNVLGIAKRFDKNKKLRQKKYSAINQSINLNVIRLLIVLGAFTTILPIIIPSFGFIFVWFGIFLLLDPLNYLLGKPSIVQKVSSGQKSILIRLFMAGITMGFFWELWNYQAYPKWIYHLPILYPNLRLFEMPLPGYLGYLPFAVETFLFYALFRSLIFKKGNDLLSIS